MTMECSYVITHRESTLSRKNNLNFILKWISSIEEDIEIILVEQDNTQKINKDALPTNCKHIFAHNEGLFNRAWGLNVGFRYASGKAVAFADNDVIIDPEILMDSFTLCLEEYNYDAIKPFNKLIDLTQEESTMILKGTLSLNQITSMKRKTRKSISFCSALTVFNRGAYQQIGGFDERFVGWGGEDDAMSGFKIPLLEKAYVAEANAFHLWHERPENEGYLQPNYQKNLQLLKAYFTYSKEDILRLCKESQSEFGRLNKKHPAANFFINKDRHRKMLISFGNEPFRRAQKRLEDSALLYFDQVISYNETDIEPDFFKENIAIFTEKQGFGYWLWKPYLILKTLNEINEGDYCFYVDSSSRFIRSPEHLFKFCTKKGGILLFDNQRHRNGIWTKSDCFALMNLDQGKYYHTLQCSAGYQLYQKNSKSISFVKEYLKYCTNYHILTNAAGTLGSELPSFRKHRHDQSVLSLLAARDGHKLHRDPSQWGNWHDSGRLGQILVNNRDAQSLNEAQIMAESDPLPNQKVPVRKSNSIHKNAVEKELIRAWASDTHVFTTQSIKQQLDPMGVGFHDFCLSVSWPLFYSQDPSAGIKVITRQNIEIPYNYHHFENLSKRFKSEYYDWVQGNVDFFWCSFSTALVHTVSKCDKPIILQMSFRYEGNIPTGMKEKIHLRDELMSLKDRGKLTVVSSNAYDSQYFKYFTGEDVDTIPLCGNYLTHRYRPVNNTVLIGPSRHYSGGYRIIEQIKYHFEKQSKYSIKTIAEHAGAFYQYKDLCECKAIIVIPYAVYSGAIVEYLSMGIPLFFPSAALMARWHIEYYNLVERKNVRYPTLRSDVTPAAVEMPDPNNDFDFASVKYWMELCEWYQWPVETFDSLEELAVKLHQADFFEMNAKLCEFSKRQNDEVKCKWKKIIGSMIQTNDPFNS